MMPLIYPRLLLLLLLFVAAKPLSAAQMERSEIVAAYVYRLAERIYWPNENKIQEYRIHIIDSGDEVSASLKSNSVTNKLHGKTYRVTRSPSNVIPEGTQVIYISNKFNSAYPEIFKQLEGRPTLLISDNMGDKRIAMINLLETADKQIHFEINKANIINQSLSIQPDIILLGGSEIDVAKLYREGQISLHEQAAQILSQQKLVAEEQIRLQQAVAKVAKQERLIEQQQQRITVEEQRFAELEKQSRKQQGLIDEQLGIVELERSKYQKLTAEIKQQEADLLQQENKIKERAAILNAQDEKIEQQQHILDQQSKTITKQQTILYALMATIVLVVWLTLMLLFSYRQKKLANTRLTEQKALLEETAQQLVEAKDAAEAANRAKSMFLTNMSHELRTPLNSILGYAQILGRDTRLDEAQHTSVEVIRQSGEHLLALIEDILDLARIESGRLELDMSDIPLLRFLNVVAGIVGVRAKQKQLEFVCEFARDLPEGIRGDDKRLRQVLLNLLSNAVKFTDQGRITLSVSRVTPSRLAFAVADTGIGIAPSDWETIFHSFEQVSDSQHRLGGTGLGLSISQQLVRLMGGDIVFESRPGEGSTFHFELELPETSLEPQSTLRQGDEVPPTTAGEMRQVPDTLVIPPAADMRELHELALQGNMRDIATFARRIMSEDAACQPFADHLLNLAQGFQSRALLTFVERYVQ
jgi:signal transduction histidine kinase